MSGLPLVVAGLGSGLVAASPVGPVEPVGRAVDEPDDERDEQALDLVAGEESGAWHGARTQPPRERLTTSIAGQGVRKSVDGPAGDHLVCGSTP